jgi:anti-sigma regulatory factor (Ser/Thr protein kinase)
MDESRVYDFVLCLGEAATNAIKHASRGEVSVYQRNGTLLLLVTDNGPGIQAINLPDVALKKGYSTTVSLGMGYKALISIADMVYLATGPEGTTVAVEMRLHPADRPVVEITLPDTW